MTLYYATDTQKHYVYKTPHWRRKMILWLYGMTAKATWIEVK